MSFLHSNKQTPASEGQKMFRFWQVKTLLAATVVFWQGAETGDVWRSMIIPKLAYAQLALMQTLRLPEPTDRLRIEAGVMRSIP